MSREVKAREPGAERNSRAGAEDGDRRPQPALTYLIVLVTTLEYWLDSPAEL